MDFEHTFRKYRNLTLKVKENEGDRETPNQDSVVSVPYATFKGATLHKGKALAMEIENYRRRVQALVHFFDLIGPHWWDRLHPFRNSFVKRPSRSANLLRLTQARLAARLSRLSPRAILPAAAAVASIEERDSISVLPKSLYRTSTSQERSGFKLENFENSQELLHMALSVARRLGEIERAKQQIILYAADWIASDGRDFNLRTRRTAILAKNVQACLIERFQGIRAIITHYYRQRSSSTIPESSVIPFPDLSHDPKAQLKHAFDFITASSLNTTNQAIFKMIVQADLNSQVEVSTGVGMLSDIQSEEMLELVSRGVSFPINSHLSNERDNYTFDDATDSQVLKTPSSLIPKNVRSDEPDFPTIQDFQRRSETPSKSSLAIRAGDLNSPITFRWPSFRETPFVTEGLNVGEELIDENDDMDRTDPRLTQETANKFAKRKEVGKSLAKFLAMKEESKKQLLDAISRHEAEEGCRLDSINRNPNRETLAVIAQQPIDSKLISLALNDRRPFLKTCSTAGDREDLTPVRLTESRKFLFKTASKQQRQQNFAKAVSTLRQMRGKTIDVQTPTVVKYTGDKLNRIKSRSTSLSPLQQMPTNKEVIKIDFRKMLQEHKINSTQTPKKSWRAK